MGETKNGATQLALLPAQIANKIDWLAPRAVVRKNYAREILINCMMGVRSEFQVLLENSQSIHLLKFLMVSPERIKLTILLV